MAAVVILIWGGGEAEYFCKQDWTGQISLIRHDKSGCRRSDGVAALGERAFPAALALSGARISGRCTASPGKP
jgi:hypothetical protein